MGVDILSFVDTDLNDLDADTLLRTLEERIGEKIQLRGFGDSPYPFYEEEDYGWSLFCWDTDLENAVKTRQLNLRKTTSDCLIELGYFNNTFMIEDLVVGKEDYNSIIGYRFNGFCRMLSEAQETILRELKHCIEMVRSYLRPITHSTRLFLCGDQEYDDDKELLADQILEHGLSIDQAISYEASSVDPYPLYTWDNLGTLMENYIGWGIFDFNLDKLPKYISSIH